LWTAQLGTWNLTTLILFVWLNVLCYTLMTSCLRKLVRVCLAAVSLTAFSDRTIKHKTIVAQNISRENIRQRFIFSSAVRVCLHSSCVLSFINIFAQNRQLTFLTHPIDWITERTGRQARVNPPCLRGKCVRIARWRLSRSRWRPSRWRVCRSLQCARSWRRPTDPRQHTSHTHGVGNIRASAFRQPLPTCRTAFPAQHLRPTGVLSCLPDGLELSPGFYPGSNEQHRLFWASIQNVLVHALLVHPAHWGF